MACPRKSASVALSLALEGEFDILLSQAFEEGPDVGDVGRGVVVENHDVVEVGGYAIKVLGALADQLDEPDGRGAATLRHDEPDRRVGRECRRR